METMTYFESAKGVTITKRRAVAELRNHGVTDEDLELFIEEEGDSDIYDAQQVLRWLGY